MTGEWRPDRPLDGLRGDRAGTSRYWLTRFVILRLLGVVYLCAFSVAAFQIRPLVGAHGLTPAASFLDAVSAGEGGRWAGFLRLPSVFWLDVSDGALVSAAWLGVALSLVVVAGFANVVLLLALWALYMSFIHVGQSWYGFGWETQLLETTLMAALLCPLLDPRPFPRRPPPPAALWLLRWLIARIMLGAGLIKIRGDSCWRDLTCLDFHFETQPVPGPLSRFFHHLPGPVLAAGVAFNHVVELVAPFFAFGPRLARYGAGALFVGLQIILIFSGNLSFLNWLTIVPALACFDDALFARVLPQALVARAERAEREAVWHRGQTVASVAALVAVAMLSIAPVANLLSPDQHMNTSFDRLHLVNTYGAFGSVGRTRPEIIFEGTNEPDPATATDWRPYEFKCKPGDPSRRPCVMSPYHYRLDWAIWFAAMSSPDRYPWTVNLIAKLLHGDPDTLSLLDGDPFPEGPPRWIRASLYRYTFAPATSDAWWQREYVGPWLPPLNAADPRLRELLRAYGWE